jgi:hypothetical protein
MESKYIYFEHSHSKAKTEVWSVRTKRDDAPLGTIEWFARWRGYAFFPGYNLVFEKNCLRDIANFLEEANKTHRQHNKAVREDKR